MMRVVEIAFFAALLSTAIGKFYFKAPFTTQDDVRKALSDFQFSIQLQSGGIKIIPGASLTRTAGSPQFEVLGLPDVMSAIKESIMLNGTTFPRHTHAEASEVVYVRQGNLQISIKLEVSEQRQVQVSLSPGGVTAIPQGLLHNFSCVGEERCRFVSYFNDQSSRSVGYKADQILTI